MPNTAMETMKHTIWTNVTQYVKYGLHIGHTQTLVQNNTMTNQIKSNEIYSPHTHHKRTTTK